MKRGFGWAYQMGKLEVSLVSQQLSPNSLDFNLKMTPKVNYVNTVQIIF